MRKDELRYALNVFAMRGPRIESLRGTSVARRLFLFVSLIIELAPGVAQADLSRNTIVGPPLEDIAITDSKGVSTANSLRALSREPWHEGMFTVSFRTGARAVEIPWCAGRKRVTVDGIAQKTSVGPAVVELSEGEHAIRFQIDAGSYEHRIACGSPIRTGVVTATHVGLQSLHFSSPHEALGGGSAVVFIPSSIDPNKSNQTNRAPLLVGLHPWNGSAHTYTAYRSLLEEAEAAGVVLLFPSGLGNSLYTSAAEDEVMRAIDAANHELPIDPSRISIWGASMGGAGATTIGFHRPDRFASVTSFFGDARYDLKTYVKSILRDEAGAHAVNPIDVAVNARHLPVWLIHGAADTISPVMQSDLLNDELTKLGFSVRFDRIAGRGHEGSLVEQFARDLVLRAKSATIPIRPARVSFKSVRPNDRSAYGLSIEKRRVGDAFIDVEWTDKALRILRAENVSRITLDRARASSVPTVTFDAAANERPVVQVSP